MEQILIPLFRISIQLIELYKWAILARILLSWVQPYPRGRFMEILYEATEPYLRLFRNLIPRISMIDFSPIVAFIALSFIQNGLARWITTLYQ